MYQILCKDRISPQGLEELNPSKYIYGDAFDNADGILVHSRPLHDMEFGSNMKAIIRVGAGFNTIPVDRCSEQGIVVFNTPGGNANAVKELVMSTMILASRNGMEAIEWTRQLQGKGTEPGKAVEKGKEVFRGPEIMGKKLGLIGVGSIGSRVAKAATALGMHTYGYDPYLTPQTVGELQPHVTMVHNPKELYETCDYISIHTPLNDETRDYLGREQIAMMKRGVYLINFARGPVINEAAVNEAIRSGHVAKFVTDFPTDEQLGMENVIGLPHLGAGTPEADQNCAYMAVHQMMDYLENGNITNSVNLPDVSARRGNGDRVCIIHRNIPAMISGISNLFSDAGMNIDSLLNRSRGTMAYTMVDLCGTITPDQVDALAQIDGVIRVLVYRA